MMLGEKKNVWENDGAFFIIINLLALELFFLILTHPVYKM